MVIFTAVTVDIGLKTLWLRIRGMLIGSGVEPMEKILSSPPLRE